MAQASIMLASVMEKLASLEEDCGKFVEKENLEAGIRVRNGLRQIRTAIDQMIKEMSVASNDIKRKRGRLTSQDYYLRYKNQGKMDDAQKHKSQELSESQANIP